MVAGKQHLGHVDAAKLPRTGVGGVIQGSPAKGVRGHGLRSHGSLDEPHRRVKDRECGNLSAGHDKVADRELLDGVEGAQPVVDPLVAAANQDQAIEPAQPMRVRLGEALACRRGHCDESLFVRRRLGDNRVEDPGEGFDAHHHAGAAAVRAFIGALAALQGVENMVVAHLDQTAFDRLANNRKPDEGCKHLGEERYQLDRQHEKAVFNLRKVSAFFRPRQQSPFERALGLMQTGQYARAEAELSRLLETESRTRERAGIFNKRGVARIEQGRREDALPDFAAALELQPAFAPALVNIGNLLLESGDVEGAIVHYEAALRSDDHYRVARLNLGVAYKKLGRHAEAVREFRRADRARRD